MVILVLNNTGSHTAEGFFVMFPVLVIIRYFDDRLAGNIPAALHDKFPGAVCISARTGKGIEPLLAELGTQLRPIREFLELRVPQEKAAVIARLHAVGQIVESRYSGKNARFKARIPPHLVAEFAPFVVEED